MLMVYVNTELKGEHPPNSLAITSTQNSDESAKQGTITEFDNAQTKLKA